MIILQLFCKKIGQKLERNREESQINWGIGNWEISFAGIT
jgi:hypothetical protein